MPEDGSSHWRLYALITLMTLLWAANFVVAKFALREIPALLVAGLRMIVAAACMYSVYASKPRAWDRKHLPKMLLLGILGVGLNQVFFALGLARTSVGHAAIIVGLSPITVLLLAAAVGQEKIRTAQLLGMLLALAGVAVLQLERGESRVSTLAGDALVLMGSTVFAVYTVAGKAIANQVGSITANTVAYIASAAALLPITVSMGAGFRFAEVTWVGWASLFYMAAFASALCYGIFYYALSRTSATRVAAFSYTQPVLATLMAVPTLGEQPGRALLVGGALVLIGVFVAERA